MAEIPKTPKDLKIKLGRRPMGGDDYETYMIDVLRQARTHPDTATPKRTH
jgi:hypothetical protein